MPRPRLNPRQKTWLSKLIAEYPWYKLREVHEGSSGDRYLLLEGIEQLPLPLAPELSDAIPGYRIHTLWVQLRVYGDPRKTAEQTYTTVYPHCDIEGKLRNTNQVGQLSLPIAVAVLEVSQVINPVIVIPSCGLKK